MIKKLIALILVFILILGGFVLVYQLFGNKNKTTVNVETTVEKPIDQITVTSREILEPKKPIIISDDDLIAQIKNKRYLESSYLALEYSKISNEKLIDVLKNYLEDSLGTKPEDIKEILDLHEKTFLNRYLKIYVMLPDSSIQELDGEIKSALYQMKSAYSTFAAYGRRGLSPEQIAEQENASADAPITFDYSEMKPQYDENSLKLGVQALESANTYVNEVLRKIGDKDIEIEKAWMDAQITSEDLTEVLNQSNSASHNLTLEEKEVEYEVYEEQSPIYEGEDVDMAISIE